MKAMNLHEYMAHANPNSVRLSCMHDALVAMPILIGLEILI